MDFETEDPNDIDKSKENDEDTLIDEESFDFDTEVMLNVESKTWLAKICNSLIVTIPTCVYIQQKCKSNPEFEEFLQHLLSLTKNLTRYYQHGFSPEFYSNCMLSISWGVEPLQRVPSPSYNSKFTWRRLITITDFNLQEKTLSYNECWLNNDDEEEEDEDDTYGCFKYEMLQSCLDKTLRRDPPLI